MNIASDHFADLHEREPRDVSSLRKLMRGYFVGDGTDPSPAGEEYPRLEWHSAVKTLRREGDDFKIAFAEKFTVRCASTYGFRRRAFAARGRAEAAQPAI